jgi:hypothetical protein
VKITSFDHRFPGRAPRSGRNSRGDAGRAKAKLWRSVSSLRSMSADMKIQQAARVYRRVTWYTKEPASQIPLDDLAAIYRHARYSVRRCQASDVTRQAFDVLCPHSRWRQMVETAPGRNRRVGEGPSRIHLMHKRETLIPPGLVWVSAPRLGPSSSGWIHPGWTPAAMNSSVPTEARHP